MNSMMTFIGRYLKQTLVSWILKKATKHFPGISYYTLIGLVSVVSILLGGGAVVSGVLSWALWEFFFVDQLIGFILIVCGQLLFRVGLFVYQKMKEGEEKLKTWFQEMTNERKTK